MAHATIRIAITVVAFYLAMATTVVEAAKGVKNQSNATGHHTMTGIVTSISPNSTGFGTFHIRSASRHKKTGMGNGTTGTSTASNANGSKTNHQTKQFNVGSTTRFEHHAGYSVSQVNAAALKTGQRVRVTATGQQAEQVHIITSQRSSGHVTRYRPPMYHPHHASHHARRR